MKWPFFRTRREEELQREMRAHLDLEAEEQRELGLPANAAREAAQRAFGNTTNIQERTRDMWAWASIDQFRQDGRYALRMLRKNPAFSVVAILTLALGIGANTAIFSVVDAVLLRPLPYRDAGRLVAIGENKPCCEFAPTSAGNYLEYEKRTQSFSNISAMFGRVFTLIAHEGPVNVSGMVVSSNFFDTLGVRAALGRTLEPTLDKPGKARALVLSHGMWQSRFARSGAVIGRTITLSGEPFTIVGVMPASFQGPRRAECWVSPRYEAPEISSSLPASAMHDWGTNYLSMIARMKDGISLAKANAELKVLSRQLERERPDSNTKKTARAVTLLDLQVGDVRLELWTLLGAVGVILLIACSNLANLLLARGTSRQRELAVRASLGAGRARLVMQLLSESTLLSLLGGALGIILALWGVHLLAAFEVQRLPRAAEIRANPELFFFALCLSVVTGFLTGAGPAWRLTRTDLNATLKQAGRANTSAPGQRLRQALVAAQIGLSLALLIGAGLLIRSFQKLLDVDPGFQAQHVIAIDLNLPSAKYDNKAKIVGFLNELRQRAATLPGVQAAGLIDALPFSGSSTNGDIAFPDRPKPRPGEEVNAEKRLVSAGYFEALGIPLLRGRTFREQDNGAEPVVIVNENLARFAWPGQNPIGKQISWSWGQGEPWMTVIGVAGNVHQFGLNDPPTLDTYIPYAQYPIPAATLAVRAYDDPASLASPLRKLVLQIDPMQPVAATSLMRDLLTDSYEQRRFQMFLLGTLAGLALLLVAIGIYGVVSYAVQQRLPEIGLRIALGASRGQVLRLMLGSVLRLALLGIAAGLLIALGTTRLTRSLLFHVGSTDPMTYLAGAGLLLALALLSGLLPATRATRIDPIVALRYE